VREIARNTGETSNSMPEIGRHTGETRLLSREKCCRTRETRLLTARKHEKRVKIALSVDVPRKPQLSVGCTYAFLSFLFPIDYSIQYNF